MINSWVVLLTTVLGRSASPAVVQFSRPQEPDTSYACSVSSPTAYPGDTIHARAYVPADTAHALSYEWSASTGQVEADGATAKWILRGVGLGPYTISATVADSTGRWRTCNARVQVVANRGRSPRPTGHALLVRGRNERQGYGLYSYLLLDAPPTPEIRARYVAVMEQVLRLTSALAELEQVPIARQRLNAGHVPVTRTTARLTADSLLAVYDYARANVLLTHVPGERHHGIFLVATRYPLSQPQPGPILVQDLSSVPERLAPLWVSEFLNAAAQERFWDTRVLHRVALHVRTIISVLGQGLPEVKSGMEAWWKWLPESTPRRSP